MKPLWLAGVSSYESQACEEEGSTYQLKIFSENAADMVQLWEMVQTVFPECTKARFDWTLSAMCTNAVGVGPQDPTPPAVDQAVAAVPFADSITDRNTKSEEIQTET